MTAPSDLTALQLLQAGRTLEALPYARRAVEQVQTCSSRHGLLATVLLRLGERAEAAAVIGQALAAPSDDAEAYDALAFVALQLGEHEQSNSLYRRATELAPSQARFWYNLASSERSLGRLEGAEAACDRAIHHDPLHFQSHLLRSELRPQTVDRNHVEVLERLITDPRADDRARMFLGYALAKELDDLGEYARAFEWFSTAAAARRRHLAYDVASDERKIARIIEVYRSRDDNPGALAATPTRHLFIVGLPRSGTTLVERMLTSLPGVRSNGETENFSAALLDATPPGSADIFARSALADPTAVARRYDALAGHDDALRLIEKLPINYLYVGAIHRALPQARVVQLTRSPLDSCFAMYRTLFGAAYPFSYDLAELARYYVAYRRLADHWQRLFGPWIHEVRYEELVTDPNTTGSALAESCGLAWHDSASQIERNAGVSLTASAAQVRRPIYSSSVGRWRHYRAQLQPLIGALRAAGVRELDSDA